MRNVGLITIDVTNTILKVKNGVGGTYKEIARRCQAEGMQLTTIGEVSASTIDAHFMKAFKHSWKAFPNFGYGHMTSKSWWHDVTCQTLETISEKNITELPGVLYNHFSTGSAYDVLPGALHALNTLRGQAPLGIITNNDCRIHSVLRELLLREYFAFVLTSYECGYAKPHPEIFQHAGSKAGVAVQDILHIGDSFANDYIAARNCGMRSILLSEVAVDGCKENHRLKSLLDINPETIEQLLANA